MKITDRIKGIFIDKADEGSRSNNNLLPNNEDYSEEDLNSINPFTGKPNSENDKYNTTSFRTNDEK